MNLNQMVGLTLNEVLFGIALTILIVVCATIINVAMNRDLIENAPDNKRKYFIYQDPHDNMGRINTKGLYDYDQSNKQKLKT